MKRRFLRPPLVPALALLVLLLAALLARWVAPHDPQQQSLLARLTPPVWLGGGTWRYPLGTDSLGRDVLSNVIYGLRTSFLAGFLSVAISVAVGATTGLFAGYRSGSWFETIALRAADVQLSLPAVLIALAVLAVFGRGLEKVIVVIGLVGWA
ncbi:MAG: ABC transporter permease, partial [bacterium]|nr:ABC transporter permease [bacterium]